MSKIINNNQIYNIANVYITGINDNNNNISYRSVDMSYSVISVVQINNKRKQLPFTDTNFDIAKVNNLEHNAVNKANVQVPYKTTLVNLITLGTTDLK